jgi:hypothetical protein
VIDGIKDRQLGAGYLRRMTLDLEPGAYALVCNIVIVSGFAPVESHYAMGMSTGLTVIATSGARTRGVSPRRGSFQTIPRLGVKARYRLLLGESFFFTYESSGVGCGALTLSRHNDQFMKPRSVPGERQLITAW